MIQKRNNTLNFSYFLILLIFTILVPIVSHNSIAEEARPLLRFPDIHDNVIVFVHGEDIWSVPATGGIAGRLTLNDGEERFPKISPDGKWIAFTGEYDGNGDVYVMDMYGGNITRLTYHPGYDEVVGWHPTKNRIIFRSNRESFSRFSKLFLISPDGTNIEKLILHEAAIGSYSPDGSRIAYNKVSREFRTWKRYKGGLAQEVYIYNFNNNEKKNITNFDGTDRIPMWVGDTIYFSSDRDRVLNIYAYDTTSDQITQITNHKDYDVRRPDYDSKHIVYEVGGAIWLLDLETKSTKQVPIEIRADKPETRPYFKKVDKFITDFHCSPDGARALIVARGDIFTVPATEGPTRNLTRDSSSRDKDAAWSPDGKKIAYISDKSGEYEIYIRDEKGREKAVQLTNLQRGYRHTLCWSPDSKKIAFADQTLRCYYIDIKSEKITAIDKAEYENIDVSLEKKPIHDFAWSPDSRYIAYSKMDFDLVYKIYIYSLEKGKTQCVSNGLFNDFNPVFSTNGEHLLFISNRRFNPTFCDFDWEMVYKKMAGIYALTLRKDGPSLFPLKSDEVDLSDNDDKSKKEDKDIRVTIDFEGISERVEAFPVPRNNYRDLWANESGIFYLNKDDGDFNKFEFRKIGPRNLYTFSYEKQKESLILEKIDGYKLSANGSHIVYQKGDKVGLISSDKTTSPGNELDLSGLEMWYNPIAEWKQIFNEAWRMERDFYYEPNMHGIDWDAMKIKYGKLIPHASCRQDIRFIIGELIGELNTSHTYIYGGDKKRQAKNVSVGMLGADYKVDTVNNLYQIEKIFKVPDWSRVTIPPLAKQGININEGDYLLEVNGERVTADKNIYSYFQNLAEMQVSLLINDKPEYNGAQEYIVKPLRNDAILRYQDWVEHNRKVVAEASNGQIGYMHLPDTYTGSATEFPKYFYSQTRKHGLIIDGRFNGGGLDPDIFLSRLDRKILSYWTRRYSHDQTAPLFAPQAHKVCLTNRQAGSGGDELPYEFQQKGMGPVIGTRTWGGLVGVSMFIDLIDGGGLTAPDYRIYDPDGKWVVENEGVQPDIPVDLNSAEMARGYDAQLMKGVDVLMKKIQENPITWPQHEPVPEDK